MKYSTQNLAKAVLKLLENNPENHQKIIESFLSFCKDKNLGYLLPNLLRYIKIENSREEDVKTLKIFSATELSDAIVKNIQKSCNSDAESPTRVIEDKDVVAGFVAYYKNKIIDASLSNNLRVLKNKLINA